MATNLTDAIRGIMLDAGMLDLDTGAGAASMEFRESDETVLLTIGLNATRAVAAAVAGVGTFNEPTTGGAAWATFSQLPSVSGTAEHVTLLDGDGVAQFELTLGTSGTEVIVDSLSFDTGVAVTTTTAPTMTMPVGP